MIIEVEILAVTVVQVEVPDEVKDIGIAKAVALGTASDYVKPPGDWEVDSFSAKIVPRKDCSVPLIEAPAWED